MLALCIALIAAPVAAVLPIESWTTSNGTRVLFVRADAIPMLDLQIDFDAGDRLSPPDRLGLASMVNAMLAKGSGELDEAAIAERLARVGAIRGGGAGDDSASVSLRTLTSEPQLDQAVGLIARLLAQPSFPQAVLEREKARVVASLREAAVRPETIVRRTFDALLYGDHPYGRHAEPETITATTRGSRRPSAAFAPRNQLHCRAQLRLRPGSFTAAQRFCSPPLGRMPASCRTVVAPQEWPSATTRWLFTGPFSFSRPCCSPSSTAERSRGRSSSSSWFGGGAWPVSIACCWAASLPGCRGSTTL